MKNILLKITALSAMFIAICNVNQTCMFWVNQPKMPEKLKLYRKI